MNNGKATYYVRQAIEDGEVKYNYRHLRKRLREHEIDMRDVEAVLFSGEVQRVVWKKDIKVWECKMVGLDSNGDQISVGLYLYKENHLIVVTTAFRPDGR